MIFKADKNEGVALFFTKVLSGTRWRRIAKHNLNYPQIYCNLISIIDLFSAVFSVFEPFSSILLSVTKNIFFINFIDWDVWESYQYWLSTSRKSQQSNCFPPNWVIFIILQLKSTQIWNIEHMITWWKWGYFEVACRGKKNTQFATFWCSEVLVTLHPVTIV